MSALFSIQTDAPEQTQRVGALIGQLAEPGDVVLLVGTLGAGKTCLVQGMAQGLAYERPVTSPTFVLMNQYEGRLTLYHVDLYRIEATIEAWDLGLDDYFFGDGVCAVEWPERAYAAMPTEYLRIDFEYMGDVDRRLTFSAAGARHERLLDEFRRGLESAGVPITEPSEAKS